LTYQELSDKLSALEQQHNQKFNDIDQVLKYLLQKDHSNNQQYVKVTYYKIKTPDAKYPVQLRFLYARKSGLVQKIEDRKY
jgi:hypothetical protein